MGFDAAMKQSATASAATSTEDNSPGSAEAPFDEEIVDAELGWMNDVRYLDAY
ncbi:hypothetical protein [Arthrobacter sp. M4]|uniref:hypothetical protein n=1 Tax=Arthrobacter sp. M4 TaxID=218160 RepID=UPI001CDC968C|nr:hypothetical protein [Arthrobacter sp. M4]MCA4135527.1 hypothetical protein [Arthrobacter sp. M4]